MEELLTRPRTRCWSCTPTTPSTFDAGSRETRVLEALFVSLRYSLSLWDILRLFEIFFVLNTNTCSERPYLYSSCLVTIAASLTAVVICVVYKPLWYTLENGVCHLVFVVTFIRLAGYLQLNMLLYSINKLKILLLYICIFLIHSILLS